MKAGQRNYFESQMSPAQLDAHKRAIGRERDAAGRFLPMSNTKQVKEVRSFRTGALDLLRAVGDLSVGELRGLFGGKTVTQIRALGVSGRASVLSAGIGFDYGKNQGAVGAQRGAEVGFWLTSAYAVGGDPQVRYADPGIPAFLAEAAGLMAEAQKAIKGGQAQNAQKPLTEAIALYDVILETSANNPDALVGKAIALRTAALASVDTRAQNNESSNVRRHAKDNVALSNQLLDQVVSRSAELGIYNAPANQITLPNLNKFIGNDELRNGVSMLAEALYQSGLGQVAAARLDGKDPFTKPILATFSRATSVGTDLGDPAKAQQLYSGSAWNGDDAVSKTHNSKLKGTLASVSEFAAGIGAKHRERYQGELEPDLRRAPGLQNAIA